MNNLYILAGRSGAGKSTIAEALANTMGAKLAKSYVDRAPRYPGEDGHVFLSREEYDELPGKILETGSPAGRYCMTEELLEGSDIAILDLKGVREVREILKDRKACVIGLSVNDNAAKRRLDGRGDDPGQRAAREQMDAAAAELLSACDIIVNADGPVENTADTILQFIRRMEQRAWVCSDPDNAQYRRRLPYTGGQPVWEFYQVNEYVGTFTVAHGRVYWADVAKDAASLGQLCSWYGYDLEELFSCDITPDLSSVQDILAECSFESAATEYDTEHTYESFEAAAEAVQNMIEEEK